MKTVPEAPPKELSKRVTRSQFKLQHAAQTQLPELAVSKTPATKPRIPGATEMPMLDLTTPPPESKKIDKRTKAYKDSLKRAEAAKGTQNIGELFGSVAARRDKEKSDMTEPLEPDAVELLRNERKNVGSELDKAFQKLEVLADTRHKASKSRKVPKGSKQRRKLVRDIDRERREAEEHSRRLMAEISALEAERGRIETELQELEDRKKRSEQDPMVTYGSKEKHKAYSLGLVHQSTVERLWKLRSEQQAIPTPFVNIESDRVGTAVPYMEQVHQEIGTGVSVAAAGDAPRKGKLPRQIKKQVKQGQPIAYRTDAERRVFAPRNIIRRQAGIPQRALPHRQRVVKRRISGSGNRVTTGRQQERTLSNIKRPNFSLIKLGPTQYKIKAVEINKAVAAQLQALLRRVPGRSIMIDGVRIPRKNAVREALRILIQKNSVVISV
jgi:hypothetical protein